MFTNVCSQYPLINGVTPKGLSNVEKTETFDFQKENAEFPKPICPGNAF